MITWIIKPFVELTLQELYDALELRQKVFVVEQNCPYIDADGKDQKAYHLLGYENGKLVAYARITHPGVMFKEVSIGRIISDTNERGKGYGKEVTELALQKVKQIYGEVPVRIAAQSYLVKFYESFGFQICSEQYDWDGIPHHDMLKENL